MSLDAIKPEAIIAACIAAATAAWSAISMIFSLQRRIEIQEQALAALKQDVATQYQALRSEQRDAHAASAQWQMHMEEKLDRLIMMERGRQQ